MTRRVPSARTALGMPAPGRVGMGVVPGRTAMGVLVPGGRTAVGGLAAPALALSAPGRLTALLCIGAATACAGAAGWLMFTGGGGARRARSLFQTGFQDGRKAARRPSRSIAGSAHERGALAPPWRGPAPGPPGEAAPEVPGRLAPDTPGRAGAAPNAPARAWQTVRWTAPLTRLAARPETVCLAAAACVAVLGRSVLPLLVGLAALAPARRAVKAHTARRARERRAREVIALCGALAGEVRAGRHPGEALLATARTSGGLATARVSLLAAARFGGDVPRALTAAAREPGAEGLLGLAACWRVAVDSGAGLAAGLDRLEAALRAEQSQRADLRAQLSGPRSTAALLAVLPVFGLLLGGALGARPLHVLLHTGAGLGCLLVGGVLEGAGLWWALRIVRNGERG